MLLLPASKGHGARRPRVHSPVNRVRFLTKVDQHVQVSQSILVLEANKPEKTVKTPPSHRTMPS